MNKFLLSLLLLTPFITQLSRANFTNSGTLRSQESTINTDVFNNIGTVEGIDCVDLECERLLGDGLIIGPKIYIVAIECAYTGTIECSEECVLTTDTPKELLKFIFKGAGKLIIKKVDQ